MIWLRYIRYLIFCLMRNILMLWVKPSVFLDDGEEIRDTKCPVVYILNSRSLIDLLVLDFECLKRGKIRPFCIEQKTCHYNFFWLENTLTKSIAPFIPNTSMVLSHIIDCLESGKYNDVQLIPVSIFWGRSPDKDRSMLKFMFDWGVNIGGRFQKIISSFIQGRDTSLYIDKRFSLKEVLKGSYDKTRKSRRVGRIVRVYFRQLRNATIGPYLPQKKIVVQHILNSVNVQACIRESSKQKGVDESYISAKANKYIHEVISNYKFSAIVFMRIILTWFLNKLYTINVYNIDKVKKISFTNTLVYLPCHRSHVDYLVLSYVLYRHKMILPYVAAGINLNMPVVGSLLRRSGAFFIRRMFKDNELYRTIVSEYLFFLSRRGFSTEYFLEGGRSRTGRLINPKIGMMTFTLKSFLRNHKKPISLVPVYLSYEKLLEVGTYLHELRGNSKAKETLMDIAKMVCSLQMNLGDASINFGIPISIDNFLDQECPSWRSIESLQENRQWINKMSHGLCQHIMKSINESVVVYSSHIVVTILLSMPRYALGETELLRLVDIYKRLITLLPYSSASVLTEEKETNLIEYVRQLGLITIQKDSIGNVVSLKDNSAVNMTYYKNNILHIFLLPSLIACLLVNNVSVSRKDMIRVCIILYPYLKKEFFLKWGKKESLNIFKRWIHVLKKEGLVCYKGKGVYCHPGLGEKGFFVLQILSRSVEETIERFYITASLLVSNKSGFIGRDELGEQAKVLAQRISRIYGANSPEFFHKILFSDFVEQLQKNGLLYENSNKKLEFGEELLEAMSEAHKLLGSDIRNSIRQIL